jgi:Fe-Mn family superoxide dismutase
MFTLPELPYSYSSLEPHIDEETMHLHHDKHHATYVTNLNAALEKYPEFGSMAIEELIKTLDKVPEDVRMTVRNNGGGHYNHSLFWTLMSPHGGGEPEGVLKTKIEEAFGTFKEFSDAFNKAGLGRFGSGWVWVIIKDNKLEIVSTPNQDSPMMDGIAPILGCDVWEHAYYLKYQNRRADYLASWWNVVDWSKVAELYQATL